MQPGGEPPPAHLVERFVQTVDVPDVALHRAEHGRAVREEVVVAEEQEGVPRVPKRRLDRVDDVGPRGFLAERALGREDLRPLGRPTAMSTGRAAGAVAGRHGPRELAVLDPGRVEELEVADPIGEDDALAVPVEAVIHERLLGLAACEAGAGRCRP